MTDGDMRDRAKELDAGSRLTAGRIIGLVALAAMLVFVVQNTGDTEVNFLWLEYTLPLWLNFVILFLLGAIVGYGFKSRRARAKRKG